MDKNKNFPLQTYRIGVVTIVTEYSLNYGSNKLALNFLFLAELLTQKLLSAELLTRKEIFIYVYGNYYLRVEKYLFTRK